MVKTKLNPLAKVFNPTVQQPRNGNDEPWQQKPEYKNYKKHLLTPGTTDENWKDKLQTKYCKQYFVK